MKIDFRDRISVDPQFADWLEKILEPAIEPIWYLYKKERNG